MPRLEAASISMTSTALPGRDFDATGALAAGLVGGPVDAIQAAGQDARNGRLAGPALAGKDVAVRDAVLPDGIGERRPDVFLSDQLGEGLGPVLAGDDLVHGMRRQYARPRVIRGTRLNHYRCFLPDLAGFAAARCTEPGAWNYHSSKDPSFNSRCYDL